MLYIEYSSSYIYYIMSKKGIKMTIYVQDIVIFFICSIIGIKVLDIK